MHDPGALLVNHRLVAVGSLGRRIPVAQPRGAGAIAIVFDILDVRVQEFEVLLVALPDALQVPQAAERGHAFRQPGVPVCRGPDAIAPPLV